MNGDEFLNGEAFVDVGDEEGVADETSHLLRQYTCPPLGRSAPAIASEVLSDRSSLRVKAALLVAGLLLVLVPMNVFAFRYMFSFPEGSQEDVLVLSRPASSRRRADDSLVTWDAEDVQKGVDRGQVLDHLSAGPDSLWTVVFDGEVMVREAPDFSAGIIGTKPTGTAFLAQRDKARGWVKLLNEPGFMARSVRGHTLLEERGLIGYVALSPVGHCEDLGLAPVSSENECRAAAVALDLTEKAGSDVSSAGAGCYASGDVAIWRGEDTGRRLKAEMLIRPICSNFTQTAREAPTGGATSSTTIPTSTTGVATLTITSTTLAHVPLIDEHTTMLTTHSDGSVDADTTTSSGRLDTTLVTSPGLGDQCEGCTLGRRKQEVTVVIPFYERDLCKTLVTAKSINIMDPQGVLGNIFLMWISAEPKDNYKAQIDEIQQAMGAAHSVSVFDFHELLGDMSGWQAQQVLKLKIASKVPSDYYIVMDAKNTFIQEPAPTTFFDECGRAKTFGRFRNYQIPEPHNRWYENAAQALGVKPPEEGDDLWPASITPMTLHRETVLGLLARFGENPDPNAGLCNGALCGRIADGATEFTLYQMFARRTAQHSCIHSVEQGEVGASLWRGEGNKQDWFAKWNLETTAAVVAGQGSTLVFGAQAGALEHMDEAQRARELEQLAEIYQKRGLFDPGKSQEELAQCVVGSSA